MTDRTEKIDTILCAAIELATTEERAAYVREKCGDDDELRSRVEDLLAAHFRAGTFLERPMSRLLPEVDLEMAEQPGTVIGRYKLLEQIGEGGFGVVFMAEQEQPVRRRVAVKIIKPGMDSRQVVARFEAERQALAMMDHSNIARIFDAGVTDTGRSYFVMELVRGVPITKYCDERKLSVRERLALFQSVCGAVQHAHQKGIIHRDIKPSNVLVADYDDQPMAKIIDFGVAKAISQPLTDKTLFTGFGQIIGTLEYMSPEQAKLNQLDIDTRTDVYSLGVLLYELLTGSTPIHKNRIRTATLGEILRIIGEEEPPRPSTRLSSSQTLPAIAAVRQTEAARLKKLVRGELDWIVMRCLEKDRNRRYQSAGALGDDIERFLADQPVEACPPSGAYRFKKFVLRNKVGVLAGALITLAIAGGFAISVIGFARARTEALRNQHISRFLQDTLAAAGPGVARGRDATLLREILVQASERVKTELKEAPEIEGDLEIILGDVYTDLNWNREAVDMYERAVACYRREPGGDNPKRALALAKLGARQSEMTDVSTGRAKAELGVAMARKCGDPETLAQCLELMADACDSWGLMSREGEPYLREALELRRRQGTAPLVIASNLERLGGTLCNAEGDRYLKEALGIYRAELDDDAPETIGCEWIIGQRDLQKGDFSQAEQSLRRVYDFHLKVYGGSHISTNILLRQLTSALAAQEKWDAAEEIMPTINGGILHPNQIALLGDISAYRGDWPAAVDRLAQARAGGVKQDASHLAVALFAAGRQQEYLDLRNELISSNDSSTDIGGDAAAAYLLLPIDETTRPLARRYADTIVTQRDTISTWKRVNKALALYRLGEFEQSLDTTEPVQIPGQYSAYRAEFLAIRALCYTALNRPSEAQTAIDATRSLLARDQRPWANNPLEAVFSWTIAELLANEAEQLLKDRAGSKDPSSPPVSTPSPPGNAAEKTPGDQAD